MSSKRQQGLTLLTTVFLIIALIGGVQWYYYARFEQSTDNAYVGAPVVALTPQRAGTVVAFYADENEFVSAGSVVVALEGTDSALALEQASALLALEARQVAQLYGTHQQLQALVSLRQVELEKATEDSRRRKELYKQKAIPEEEVIHTQQAEKVAMAQLQVATRELAIAAALVKGVSPLQHPRIVQASTQLKQAYLRHARRELRAPVSGFITKRIAYLGQEVTAGQPLLSIVPLEQVWVEANFKEDQLKDLRIGQPVTLRSDWYGKKLVYHGTVAGISAGTGSAFSLLPAQNATGNWIKVIQRVPVRIRLSPAELGAHPLRLGLSMQAIVDTRTLR
eukprot:TRINITY_DN10318_c0_g1_i1.p1 TRINITY_DN10318_c0_g1~~TRINITY_DN10318_c0_g1_i1.p1  ORF type:complete len:337 (-),score=-24.40 TRINITY_DN10318_c0_g1_i1:3-1013(-)